jgi:hypothetical protein
MRSRRLWKSRATRKAFRTADVEALLGADEDRFGEVSALGIDEVLMACGGPIRLLFAFWRGQASLR